MKKIAFLDRDGVINKRAREHEYIRNLDDFHFNSGLFSVLSQLKKEGFEFIIITNQRGIARGFYSEEDLISIHAYMVISLQNRGYSILDVFFCPHENNMCSCRKPKPGMLEFACKKYEIDLANSILISDSEDDVKMGKDFGVGGNYFVRSDSPEDFLELAGAV